MSPNYPGSVSSKDINNITLEYFLDGKDAYTEQFVENILGKMFFWVMRWHNDGKRLDEAKHRPAVSPVYASANTVKTVRTQPASRRQTPYSLPAPKVEEISSLSLAQRIRKTPIKGQKIHATDKCQIVKIEQDT